MVKYHSDSEGKETGINFDQVWYGLKKTHT